MPFAYSRNNKELKNLNDGPAQGGNECAKISDCWKGCMTQTFLEVSWSKCKKDEIHAYTHLSKRTII